MLKILIHLSFLIPVSPLFSQADSVRVLITDDGYKGPSEKMPEFVGGQENMYKLIYGNLHYPALARRKKIQGTVIVEFTVDVDSLARKIHILKGIGGGCDEEVLRVMSLMSTHKLWHPGRHEFKAVPVTFSLPFKFDLTEMQRKSK